MKSLLVLLGCFAAAGCNETRPATTVTPDSPAHGSQTSGMGATSMQQEPPRERVAPAKPAQATARSEAVATSTEFTPQAAAPVASPTPPRTAPAGDSPRAATDTGINERDRGPTLTPMDQGGGDDVRVTADIRRAVVGDSALSFSAKNVKIITTSGKVTLRGPVKTAAERASIEQKARNVSGVREIDNQLEIATK